MTPLDRLELELRRLPGVAYVGFLDRRDTLVVQLLVVGGSEPASVRPAAERLCQSHLDRPFHLDLAGSSRPTRVRILDVRQTKSADSTDCDDLEVHLGYEGVRTIGRARSGDPQGAAAATFEALKRLGARVPFHVEAAALFEHTVGEGVMLVLSSPSAGDRYGVAAADSVELAAVRATLHPLNRYLATQTLPALAV